MSNINNPAIEIVKDPNCMLRDKSAKTSLEFVRKIGLVGVIQSALLGSWTEGVGLAAVQVAMPIRAAWLSTKGGREILMVNPEIIQKHDYQAFQSEGCLSIPGKRFNTGRYRQISVYGDFIIDGKEHKGCTIQSSGFEAAVIQHEIDHMDGILCKDDIREYREPAKTGRNDSCPCGSGLKFKKCCL